MIQNSDRMKACCRVLFVCLSCLWETPTASFVPSFAATKTDVACTHRRTLWGTKKRVSCSMARLSNEDDHDDNDNGTDAVGDISNDGFTKSIQEYNFGTVLQNLAGRQGDWGSRGEVYFVSQAILVPCFLWGSVPLVGDSVRILLAAIVGCYGAVVTALSFVGLGDESLSPFPKPTASGTLKTRGIYQTMRHPMYSGLLSLQFGVAIGTNSLDRFLLTALLAYFIDQKADKEEEYLMEQFTSEYAEYKVRNAINWSL